MQKVREKTSLNSCLWQDRASRENNVSATVAANRCGFGSA